MHHALRTGDPLVGVGVGLGKLGPDLMPKDLRSLIRRYLGLKLSYQDLKSDRAIMCSPCLD